MTNHCTTSRMGRGGEYSQVREVMGETGNMKAGVVYKNSTFYCNFVPFFDERLPL